MSLTNKKRNNPNKIGNEKGEIRTDTTGIQTNKQQKKENTMDNLYENKFDNPEEIYKFLETYIPSKLNQEVTDSVNRLIAVN